MRLTMGVTAMVLGMAAVAAAADEPAPELKNDAQKASYAIGVNIGSRLKSQATGLDADALARGIRDALQGGKTALSEEQMQQAIEAFGQQQAAREQEGRKTQGDANLKEGEAFLAANASKEGVKVLPSGLQYKVIKEGTGAVPTKDDVVEVHYRGTLISGKEFDSSYKRNETATFPVTGVIPGWTEILQLMPKGSKWQVYIPSKLAYRERGAGPDIGPNATLLFEIELVDIKKDGQGK